MGCWFTYQTNDDCNLLIAQERHDTFCVSVPNISTEVNCNSNPNLTNQIKEFLNSKFIIVRPEGEFSGLTLALANGRRMLTRPFWMYNDEFRIKQLF